MTETRARPASGHAAIEGLRHDLALAFRAAAMHGMNEGIDNHFSVAVPGTESFMINRYGPDWSELTAEDILVVDMAGNVLQGSGSWDAAAFTIHKHLHVSRPDAAVIFHTHMTAATAVALTQAGLSTRLSQAAMYFHGAVVTVDYNGFINADDEGERLCRAVGTRSDVVLLRNHGVMVLAPTIATAWHRLYFLDRAAQLQVLATSQGVPLIEVSDTIASRTAAQWREIEEPIADQLFAAVRRRLIISNPTDGGRGVQ